MLSGRRNEDERYCLILTWDFHPFKMLRINFKKSGPKLSISENLKVSPYCLMVPEVF